MSSASARTASNPIRTSRGSTPSPFPLVADPDKSIVTAYGVWTEKKNYGRSYMGTVRTTFVIDEQGVVSSVFGNVKVKGHADTVIASL